MQLQKNNIKKYVNKGRYRYDKTTHTHTHTHTEAYEQKLNRKVKNCKIWKQKKARLNSKTVQSSLVCVCVKKYNKNVRNGNNKIRKNFTF